MRESLSKSAWRSRPQTLKSVFIEYQREGRRQNLLILNEAEVDIETLTDQGGAVVTISNLPMGIGPGQALVVTKSKRPSYRDYGLQLEVSRKTDSIHPSPTRVLENGKASA
jgi:hypothetical protein